MKMFKFKVSKFLRAAMQKFNFLHKMLLFKNENLNCRFSLHRNYFTFLSRDTIILSERFEASAVSFFKKSIARGSFDTCFLCKLLYIHTYIHMYMYSLLYTTYIIFIVCVTCFIGVF